MSSASGVHRAREPHLTPIDRLDEVDDQALVVLVGSASWCGPCQTYKPQVATAASLISGVFFGVFDASTSDLADKFKVTMLPTTLVLARNGKTGALEQVHACKGSGPDKLAEALIELAKVYQSTFAEGARPASDLVLCVGQGQPPGLARALGILFRGVHVREEARLRGMEVHLLQEPGGSEVKAAYPAAGLYEALPKLYALYFGQPSTA